jgi:hypothetical protein
MSSLIKESRKALQDFESWVLAKRLADAYLAHFDATGSYAEIHELALELDSARMDYRRSLKKNG